MLCSRAATLKPKEIRFNTACLAGATLLTVIFYLYFLILLFFNPFLHLSYQWTKKSATFSTPHTDCHDERFDQYASLGILSFLINWRFSIFVFCVF